MEQLLLKNMLFASSLVMYGFGLFSLLTIDPKGEEYYSYRVARKIFGVFVIFLASCLLLHWHFDFREHDPLLASSLCLLYTTLGTMIISVIFTSLIQSEYPFRKRLIEIACYNTCLIVALAINYLFVAQGAQHFLLIAAAILFAVIMVIFIRRFFKTYRQTLNRADNYYSDNIGKILSWIPITINSTVLLVLATAVLSIVADISFISLDLLFGLIIITYIFISLQNYMINISKLKMLLLTDEQSDTPMDCAVECTSEAIEAVGIAGEDNHECQAIKLKLDKWIKERGFTKQGLTLDDLATELNTNRAYLSSYINTEHNLTFRGWVSSQRIEYSKELLLQSEELSAATIAAKVGYSQSVYIKTFAKAEGIPPMQWRNNNKHTKTHLTRF